MAVFKRMQPLLGTWFELSIDTAESSETAHRSMSLAFDEARRLERVFNVFDMKSEISRVNAASPGEWSVISGELAEVLTFGAELERDSSRAFRLMPGTEASAPEYALTGRAVCRHGEGTFDLGGIAKGYVVDRIFDFLQSRHPGAAVLVNAGGDIRCSGAHRIEVRVPSESGEERRYELVLRDEALATSSLLGAKHLAGRASASYPAHSLLGRTGASSAVVRASSCMTADAMTKVALFGGPGALA